MSTAPRVLIVDDEAFVRESLKEVLSTEGILVRDADNARAAAELVERADFDVVLTDLKLSAEDGMWLLERVRSSDPSLPVIVFTGAGSVNDAVRAMKAGAFDFVLKPIDPDELGVLVRRAAEHHALLAEVGQLRREVRELRRSNVLVGSSAAMEAVRAAIHQVAPSEATVLLTGESGTGKELAAEAIHRESRRAERTYLEVNCAAIPAELFESELFGHRRGSFNGAVADRRGPFTEGEGGTLVLDEVGTLSASMQAKLLRVLETGEYQMVGDARTRVADVRVIAITNEDLPTRVREETFRKDLYYRLNVFPIELPPLRRRKEDLPELTEYLLSSIRGTPSRLGREALDVLASYDWPGNVRELRNVLERAVIVAGAGKEVDEILLGRILESTLPRGANSGTLHMRELLDAHEKELLLQALARTGGRRREAAESLGIDPRNLSYYLKKHGIAERGPAGESA